MLSFEVAYFYFSGKNVRLGRAGDVPKNKHFFIYHTLKILWYFCLPQPSTAFDCSFKLKKILAIAASSPLRNHLSSRLSPLLFYHMTSFWHSYLTTPVLFQGMAEFRKWCQLSLFKLDPSHLCYCTIRFIFVLCRRCDQLKYNMRLM